MQKHLSFLLSICLLIFSCNSADQKVNLEVNALFSDHMVLQQQENVAFWGHYAPSQEVKITGSWGEETSAQANANGQWETKIKTPEAGGPYTVKIETQDSTITLNDVLIGEVWLASGQSNMEMPMRGFSERDSIEGGMYEIAHAQYPEFRMFTVGRNMTFTPLDTLSGSWMVATPQSVPDFSATAYFFAKKLHEELNVPIGIIHSSWGGTVAEAWTSREKLKTLGDFDEAIESLTDKSKQQETDNWFKQWPTATVPTKDNQWESINFNDLEAAKPNFNDEKWIDMEIPGRFDQLATGDFDGAVWLRSTFTVEDIEKKYTLNIGAVDDMDATYINGQKVGGLAGAGYWNMTRKMVIPKGLLKAGTNSIAIRAIDTGGPGVVTGPVTLSDDQGDTISLAGDWKYHVIAEIFQGKFYVYDLETDLSKRPVIFQFNPNLPTVLYNAMISPLVPYTIKGAIWYQGEANVGRAEQYKRLFPAMIKDWRSQWDADFPFYFVQIAPYVYNPSPNQQVSQELRDAQRYALKTPKTGMVVTLDIGNPDNIHPAQKAEVGQRLAGLALANDYGKDMVASGPLFKSVNKSGNKLIVKFDFVGSGLAASEDGLSGFEIAGADKKYVQATATIVGNTIEVMSPKVDNPQFVRYAWGDAAEASLFNEEGLPASSFTSEE